MKPPPSHSFAGDEEDKMARLQGLLFNGLAADVEAQVKRLFKKNLFVELWHKSTLPKTKQQQVKRPIYQFDLMCCHGKKNAKRAGGKHLRSRTSTYTGCPSVVRVKQDDDSKQWRFTKLDLQHVGHLCNAEDLKVLPSAKRVPELHAAFVKTLEGKGGKGMVKQVQRAQAKARKEGKDLFGGDGWVLDPYYFSNLKRREKKAARHGKSETEHIIDTMAERGYEHKVCADEHGRVKAHYFVATTHLELAKLFMDVAVVDAT